MHGLCLVVFSLTPFHPLPRSLVVFVSWSSLSSLIARCQVSRLLGAEASLETEEGVSVEGVEVEERVTAAARACGRVASDPQLQLGGRTYFLRGRVGRGGFGEAFCADEGEEEEDDLDGPEPLVLKLCRCAPWSPRRCRSLVGVEGG